jgi:hypothetical protein
MHNGTKSIYVPVSKNGSNGNIAFVGTYNTSQSSSWYSPDILSNAFKHSTDNGKTWLPCGVTEE